MSLSECTAVIVSGDGGGKTVRWEKWQQFSCFMWLIWGARGPVWVMCVYTHSIYILTGYLAGAAVSWQGELHVRTCRARWEVLPFKWSDLRINVSFKAVCSEEVRTNPSHADPSTSDSNRLMLYCYDCCYDQIILCFFHNFTTKKMFSVTSFLLWECLSISLVHTEIS